MEFSEGEFYDESETDADSPDDSEDYPSDDSHEDPTFEVFEGTPLTQKNLPLKRRFNRLNTGSMDEIEEEGELTEQEIIGIVKEGHVDCLKVEECKIYLRKYGLRLSGSKETLIQRIKEHSNIIKGGGVKKYPASSFVLNCKGDACMGDVVMFKQKVYKKNGASRSVKVGPYGTRVVAGRIVKESYGAARQQHTFTIEVLWSRGEKPLPPLRPLLIKGRNLYRLRTMRQKWEDEGERQKILLEKHARGSAARLKRRMEMQTRPTRNEHSNGKKNEKSRGRLSSVNVKPENPINQQPRHQQPRYARPPGSQSANVYYSNGPAHESYYNEQHVNDFTVFPNSNFRVGSSSTRGTTWERYNERHANFSRVRSPIRRRGPAGSQSTDFYYSNGPAWESYNEQHANDFTVFPNLDFRGDGSSTRSPTWERYNERHANLPRIRSPIRGRGPTVFPNSNYRRGTSVRSPLRSVHSYSQQRHKRRFNTPWQPSFQ